MVVPHICFLNPKASQAEGTQSWPISIRAPGRCPGALPCQSWHRAGAPSPCGRRCWAHAHWGCRREAMGLRVRASDKCVIPGVRWNGSSSLLRESPILPSLLSICGSPGMSLRDMKKGQVLMGAGALDVCGRNTRRYIQVLLQNRAFWTESRSSGLNLVLRMIQKKLGNPADRTHRTVAMKGLCIRNKEQRFSGSGGYRI